MCLPLFLAFPDTVMGASSQVLLAEWTPGIQQGHSRAILAEVSAGVWRRDHRTQTSDQVGGTFSRDRGCLSVKGHSRAARR